MKPTPLSPIGSTWAQRIGSRGDRYRYARAKEKAEAIAVACPFCGAAPGNECPGLGGEVHRKRRDAGNTYNTHNELSSIGKGKRIRKDAARRAFRGKARAWFARDDRRAALEAEQASEEPTP